MVRPEPAVPEGVQRVMKECTSLKLSASLIEVDPAYYTWTLQERWCVYCTPLWGFTSGTRPHALQRSP